MRGPSFEEVRLALVMSLAVDGYIDIEGHDGEDFLYGDLDGYGASKIEEAAESIHRFLTMDVDQLEFHRAEVLARRKQEGRE